MQLSEINESEYPRYFIYTKHINNVKYISSDNKLQQETFTFLYHVVSYPGFHSYDNRVTFSVVFFLF